LNIVVPNFVKKIPLVDIKVQICPDTIIVDDSNIQFTSTDYLEKKSKQELQKTAVQM
jgi:hypothetical protein